MAVDELTDEAFSEAYQSNPSIKGRFEEYQMKHKAHPSQKGQPDYDPNNRKWYEEAKHDPKIVNAVKAFVQAHKESRAPSQTHTAKTQSAYLADLVGFGAAAGLFAIAPPAGLAVLTLMLMSKYYTSQQPKTAHP